MKVINKIGIAASLVMTALISSCSDKGYWDEAPREDAYSFNAENYNEELKPGPQEVKITLHRSSTAQSASVDVTFTPGKNCPSDITVQSPVVFQAGSSTADIIINIANANPPYTYSGTLKFSGEKSYAGIAECAVNMPVSYTWKSLGTGKFYDGFVMDETMFDVEILQAEGFNRYRVLNPYKEFYETGGEADYASINMYGSTGSSYIEFWETSNGLLLYNAWNTGLIYQGNPAATILAYPWTAFTNGVEGYDGWKSQGYAILSPIYYVTGVGGYGQQPSAVHIMLP